MQCFLNTVISKYYLNKIKLLIFKNFIVFAFTQQIGEQLLFAIGVAAVVALPSLAFLGEAKLGFLSGRVGFR